MKNYNSAWTWSKTKLLLFRVKVNIHMRFNYLTTRCCNSSCKNHNIRIFIGMHWPEMRQLQVTRKRTQQQKDSKVKLKFQEINDGWQRAGLWRALMAGCRQSRVSSHWREQNEWSQWLSWQVNGAWNDLVNRLAGAWRWVHWVERVGRWAGLKMRANWQADGCDLSMRAGLIRTITLSIKQTHANRHRTIFRGLRT